MIVAIKHYSEWRHRVPFHEALDAGGISTTDENK